MQESLHDGKSSCLVCFSLPFESAAFRRRLRGVGWNESVRIFHGGVGVQHFVPALQRALKENKPSSIILAGFCAGLHVSATPGTLFQATSQEVNSFVRSAGEVPVLMGKLRFPHSLTSPLPGGLVSVPEVLATGVEKASVLHRHPRAVTADMETLFALRNMDFEGNIEILRVVSDGLDEDLPLPAALLFDPIRQNTPLRELIWHLATHPGCWLSFQKFVHSVRTSREVLGGAVMRVLEARVPGSPGRNASF